MNKAAPGENYIEIKKCISFLNKKKVKIICQDLAIETIDQLEGACKAKRVSGLHGFGIKTEKKILEAIKIYKNPPPLEIIHFLDYCISIVIGSFIMMIYGPILGYELETGRIEDNQAVFSCISMCVNAFGGPFFLIILFRFMRHRWKTAKDSDIKQMKNVFINKLVLIIFALACCLLVLPLTNDLSPYLMLVSIPFFFLTLLIKKISDLFRKHGGKAGEELKAEGDPVQ